MDTIKDKFIATLLAGAIGDALGYPVEFLTLEEIKSIYGYMGINELVLDKYSGKALISDDTQMTLFTADGLIWAEQRMRERGIGSYVASGVYPSYIRWYYTQYKKYPNENGEYFISRQHHEDDKGIMSYEELYSRRAPGISCLTALASGEIGTIEKPINDSKGCGGVMRVAPVGLLLNKSPKYAFQVGAEVAAITHGHPTGYLASGVLAMIIAELVNGMTLLDSIHNSIEVLKRYRSHEEVLRSINRAVELAKCDIDPEKAINELGEGWIAEEALAVALYCALKTTDFKEALILAVNHDGDSDSTGAICGNILGALYGMDVIPKDWIENLELKELIISMGEKLSRFCRG